jgi:hypothetical protein
MVLCHSGYFSAAVFTAALIFSGSWLYIRNNCSVDPEEE